MKKKLFFLEQQRNKSRNFFVNDSWFGLKESWYRQSSSWCDERNQTLICGEFLRQENRQRPIFHLCILDNSTHFLMIINIKLNLNLLHCRLRLDYKQKKKRKNQRFEINYAIGLKTYFIDQIPCFCGSGIPSSKVVAFLIYKMP